MRALSSLRRRFAAAAIFLLGLVPATAQSFLIPTTNAPATNAPAATAPVGYGMGDVVNQAQAAAVKFQNYANQISPDTEAQAAHDVLATLTHTVDRRLESDRHFAESVPSLDHLQTSQTAWQGVSSDLDDLQKRLSDRVNSQHALLADLATMKTNWQATQQNATKAKAPPEILQTTQQVLGQIDDTVKATRTDLEGLYKLQVATAQQADRVNTGLGAVNTAINAAQARLLQQTQPALWEAAALTGGGETMMRHESVSLAGQLAELRGYLSDKIGSILLLGFLTAIILAAFYGLRGIVSASAQQDVGLGEAEYIFDAPVSNALLLTFLACHWLYPPSESPRLLSSLLGVLLLIPTVVIIRRLVTAQALPLLYAMVVAYIVDQVRNAATPDGTFARFLLLAEIIAACLFVLGALRSRHLSACNYRASVERLVRFYFHSAFYLMLAAGFADVLGYGQLGMLMANGVLESSYLALIFYAAVRIIDALVQASLSLRPLSTFGMVRHYRDLVASNITFCIRWAATALWTVFALQFFSLRNPLWDRAQAFCEMHLQWGALDIQMGALLAFPITVWAAFALSRLIRFALEEDVYPNLNLPRGIPYAVSTVVHYAILVFGFFTALGAMGINLGNYAVLAGAFGVGLGFGLQNIMNNFMSGLILLFERPVKVGDTIQIDANTIGRVERVGIRASVILLTNGAELIVPNGSLISNPVTNWTLSNNERLIEVPINVAPKTDVQRALDTLLTTAKAHSAVLKNPPPQAVVVAIAAASTSLKLRCWIDSEEVDWMKVTSELSLAIQIAFEKENIALA